MKLNYDGKTISFSTSPQALFEAEKSGLKNNTVRILTRNEWARIQNSAPQDIVIEFQHEIFLRHISHIHLAGEFLGHVLVIFTWHHSGGIQDVV